jgi:hypothetical protein
MRYIGNMKTRLIHAGYAPCGTEILRVETPKEKKARMVKEKEERLGMRELARNFTREQIEGMVK